MMAEFEQVWLLMYHGLLSLPDAQRLGTEERAAMLKLIKQRKLR